MNFASLLPATARLLRAPVYSADGSRSLKDDMITDALERRRSPSWTKLATTTDASGFGRQLLVLDAYYSPR